MLFINHLKENEWWRWDVEKMCAYNYNGGFHDVHDDMLLNAECFECNSWHELYLTKHFCPLEVGIWENDIWISPEGKYYGGKAHEVAAERLLELIYGEDVDYCAGDKLESYGWVRATTSLMWSIRFDEWKDKCLTQKQYDALYDWCKYHKMNFPRVSVK